MTISCYDNHLSLSGWMAWRWRWVLVVYGQRVAFKHQFDSKDFCVFVCWSVDFCRWVNVLCQNKSSFGAMFSVSSESLKASDREAVVWTKTSRLNAADIYFVCFKKGLKFKFFGSHSFSIPVADVEVVASRSTLSFTSYVFRVRDASRWGWAPLRLGARHRLYLAIHRDDTITISRMQHNHVIAMHRCMVLTLPRRQASSDFEGLHGCNFGVFLLLGRLPAMVHDSYLSRFGFWGERGELGGWGELGVLLNWVVYPLYNPQAWGARVHTLVWPLPHRLVQLGWTS